MHLAKEAGLKYTDLAFAKYLDERDSLKHLSEQFHIPTNQSLMGGMEFLASTRDPFYSASLSN